MSAPEPSYHVVLLPGVEFAALPLALRLAPLLAMHPVDVAQRLRYGGGFLARDASADLARQIESVARALGVETATVPADGPLERVCVRSVRSIWTFDDALWASCGTGVESFALEDVSHLDLVAFGKLDPLREHPAGKRPSKRTPEERLESRIAAAARQSDVGPPPPYERQLAAFDEHRRTAKPQLYLTLGSGDSILFIDLSTTYPALDPRRARDWRGNLFGLCHALIQRLPAERVFRSTRVFWSNGDLSAILVDRQEVIENRQAWLTILIRNRLWNLPPAPGRPSPSE
ncbi:MAG: hypothetical protein L0Z55_10360 [Planctomycetes bacterium]|nr:hypothetical protein [Planctomycetota bacterium]